MAFEQTQIYTPIHRFQEKEVKGIIKCINITNMFYILMERRVSLHELRINEALT
jgi:hypothetical protein